MPKLHPFIIAAVVAAATVGEGVFAMPYVIQSAGWATALMYFVAVTAVVSVAHVLYLRTLAAVDEKERLLGLAKRYFGGTGFWIGFVAIVVGLLLSFVAYLALGTRFLAILFPGISGPVALAVFWFLLAILIWGSDGRISWLAGTGVALVSCAILFIFFSGHPASIFLHVPVSVPANFFLPFGAVLFALAGWTCVEPVYEIVRREGFPADEPARFWNTKIVLFVAGSAFASLLYWLFAAGVIDGGAKAATDTISGVAAWPLWRRDILAIVGVLSVAVVTVPIARETRNALEKDLGWNSYVSRALLIFLPLAAILAGLHDFLTIVGIAGGIFISTQYLLIISVGRRTLPLSLREKLLLDIVAVVFVLAAVYEIWHFVV